MKLKLFLNKNFMKGFITPLSISALSKNKVYHNEFNLNDEIEMDHIALQGGQI